MCLDALKAAVNGRRKRFGAVGRFPPCQRKRRKVWGNLSAAAAIVWKKTTASPFTGFDCIPDSIAKIRKNETLPALLETLSALRSRSCAGGIGGEVPVWFPIHGGRSQHGLRPSFCSPIKPTFFLPRFRRRQLQIPYLTWRRKVTDM
ncbi:hypothetical protein C4D60_Mb07t14320 [Musa balbisiana]|uniref:Uncharacterized protein n=1 Tax=Musa balbisiana TaxID=52838 RepID=A0A4S8JH69_MUSBA|nr:hypothetical protein C4D60_Mb07t14320 [Musa balbisiana]